MVCKSVRMTVDHRVSHECLPGHKKYRNRVYIRLFTKWSLAFLGI